MINILNQYLTSFNNIVFGLESKDFFDIFVVAVIIYAVILFIKQTRSYFIVYAAGTLFLLNYFAEQFDLSLTRTIFQPLLTFIIVIFAVVFQRELRRFFIWFSVAGRRSLMERKIAVSGEVTNNIVDAVITLAKRKVGALIVFAGDYPLENLVEGGFALDGRVSVPLLLSIFDPSTPGHDGAILIDNNKVKRFGGHLPLAENIGKVARFGTRHRAALGLSERTDALILVVSEEKGTISIAEGGEIETIEDPREIESRIISFMKEDIVDGSKGGVWHYAVKRNLWPKVIAGFLAIFAWFFFIYQSGVVTKQVAVPIEFISLPKDVIVSQLQPREVRISVSGSYDDVHNLSDGSIKASIDLAGAGLGQKEIYLVENNITYPRYLTITNISPRRLRFNLEQGSLERR